MRNLDRLQSAIDGHFGGRGNLVRYYMVNVVVVADVEWSTVSGADHW